MFQIREERPEDYEAIYDLIQGAFSDKDYSRGTEGPIVNALRQDGDLSLSLVALQNDIIVGHIAFSPVSVGNMSAGVFGLGPVAADIDLRFQGIGSALINEGLSRVKARGARLCVLIGDPNYYQRFGFINNCGLTYGDLPADYIQALVWQGDLPMGEVIYAPGFSAGSNQP